MPKVLSCKDVGVDCDWRVCGETEQEVMVKAAEHARTVHSITGITPEMEQKVKSAIKDEDC